MMLWIGLAALTGGSSVYWMFRGWGRVGANGLAEYARTASSTPVVEKIGEAALRVSGLSLPRWNADLRWAQLGRADGTSRLAPMVGLSLLMGLGGALLATLAGVPVLWFGAGLAMLWPWLQLRSQAEATRRLVRRALPELAALLAAEMAANIPAERALERLAAWPGPLAAIVQEALRQSQRTGRPLFSRRPTVGTLLEAATVWSLPPLTACARQIDLAATQGVAGAEQMQRVARSLTRDYREELLRRSERLESALMVPSMVFIFLPFLVAVIATVGLPVLEAFR